MSLINLFKSKRSTPTSSPKSTISKTNRSTTSSDLDGETIDKKQKNDPKRKLLFVSASSPSLLDAKNDAIIEKKTKKRPISTFFKNSTKSRRGQQQSSTKPDDDLSRTSSVTNLNVVESTTASGTTTTKPIGSKNKTKKSDSKDRLDKYNSNSNNNDKKHERKISLTLQQNTKNNNKEIPMTTPVQQEQQIEIELLQKQLTQMANEKTNLALQLGEQTGQLNTLQNEISKLKILQDQANQQLEQLIDENTLLRNRLRDVAHSPLSDTEKQQLLYESRHHSSAPASIATNLIDDGGGNNILNSTTSGDITTCPTPEWDKHSSSNVSEVSVACLQDKINQMQETHYSTNEELQATLQELTDLQKQLIELQQENERLIEEKNLMFESLCRQTERLNDARNEIESLKQIIYDSRNQQEQINEEQQLQQQQINDERMKLLDLIKTTQLERDDLLMKNQQLNDDLNNLNQKFTLNNDDLMKLREHLKKLESILDIRNGENQILEQEILNLKDLLNNKQIELNHIKDLFDNTKQKLQEYENEQHNHHKQEQQQFDNDQNVDKDKSDYDELLDNLRKDKNQLEQELITIKEQYIRNCNELEKLHEQLLIQQNDIQLIRNNSNKIQTELEFKLENLLLENEQFKQQLNKNHDYINELKLQLQLTLDDKKQLQLIINEQQRNLNDAERKIVNLESELNDVKRLRQEQEEEWERFQDDLLTSVRVANDFKTEAQQDLQRMIMENKAERERIKQLEAQIDKLKEKSDPTTKTTNVTATTTSVPTTTTTNLPIQIVKVNKRDNSKKSSTNQSKTARLSKEEEVLLAKLKNLYDDIDPNLTEDQLNIEQRVIKKLKYLYDNDLNIQQKRKPIALKPKNCLAISKPLLNSVILNPKLNQIANDPNLRNVERYSVAVPNNDNNNNNNNNNNSRNVDEFLDDLERLRNSHGGHFYNPQQIMAAKSEVILPLQPISVDNNNLIKSKSLNEIDYLDQNVSKLRRYNSHNDLTIIHNNNQRQSNYSNNSNSTKSYDDIHFVFNETITDTSTFNPHDHPHHSGVGGGQDSQPKIVMNDSLRREHNYLDLNDDDDDDDNRDEIIIDAPQEFRDDDKILDFVDNYDPNITDLDDYDKQMRRNIQRKYTRVIKEIKNIYKNDDNTVEDQDQGQDDDCEDINDGGSKLPNIDYSSLPDNFKLPKYEPVYVSFDVNSTTSSLPLSVSSSVSQMKIDNKPIITPRSSLIKETQLYEDFGGGLRKTVFTIQHDNNDNNDNNNDNNNYSTLDRFATFHILNEASLLADKEKVTKN